MTKELTKVVYKPDSQSTDEYIMIVNKPEVRTLLPFMYASYLLSTVYDALLNTV